MANYELALPEMFLLGMTCFVLVFDLFISDRNRVFTYLLAQITLLGTALITISQMSGQSGTAFGGTFVRDAMGDVLKLFVYVITASVFLYSRDYLAQRNLFKGEYYILGLFGVLGMMVMISASNFLTIYLGLELMSLAMYSMVAFNRDSAVSTESAMKYFVLGAIASGMLLYGMSMIYGVTGTLELGKIAAYISTHGVTNIILSFGLVFLVVGIAFKLGAVPFHMWLPDVYHGAPTSVTLYIASAPKIAAFAMAMRLLVDGMELMHADWQQMLIILSVLSLAIGNIVAIAQTNLKRMLAYSTISHVGYLVLGILSGKADGYSASMFYTLTYAIMTLGSFGMIILLSRSGFEADNLDDFKGLNERSPWYAFIMLILMFSMAGVPPTVGFFAKLWVLEAVIKADMAWLAAVAVFFSIIGAYYYIRIVKLMYFDKPEDSQPIECGRDMRILVSTNGLVVLALGIIPGALMSICNLVIS